MNPSRLALNGRDAVSGESLRVDNACMALKPPTPQAAMAMIAFLQENSVYSLKDGIGESEATVQIYVGEKENQSMKKSAKIIHEKLQDSFIQVLPNMYHGEFSINHADDYVRKLLEIVK